MAFIVAFSQFLLSLINPSVQLMSVLRNTRENKIKLYIVKSCLNTMKAIAITPGVPETQIIEIDEPQITAPNQVKLQVLEVGICGTDREVAEGGRADAPAHSSHLVIGHEVFGRIVEVGAEVSSVRKGDYAALTVRRGCGKCEPCLLGRSDMCYTSNYTERGIKARHGYQTEYVVDQEQYVVKVPEQVKMLGVLAEPMSVVQKAIIEAINIQTGRLPTKGDSWISGKRVIVAGIGAIGILAVIALRLRGAEVIGIDIVDEDSSRPRLLKQLGGSYINSRRFEVTDLDDKFGQIDMIVEAAGVAKLGFELIDALGINGIYVMTGIPGEGKPVCIAGGETMSQIVLKNQVIMGSVNASAQHFESGIADLEKARERWAELIDGFITARVSYTEFAKALDMRSEDDIKTVVTW